MLIKKKEYNWQNCIQNRREGQCWKKINRKKILAFGFSSFQIGNSSLFLNHHRPSSHLSSHRISFYSIYTLYGVVVSMDCLQSALFNTKGVCYFSVCVFLANRQLRYLPHIRCSLICQTFDTHPVAREHEIIDSRMWSATVAPNAWECGNLGNTHHRYQRSRTTPSQAAC